MSKVITFPSTKKAKLIAALKEMGYSEKQIEEAIVKAFTPDDDPTPPRPKKRIDPNVIEFKDYAKVISMMKKAA